jgi:hypothetical protein
MRASDQELAETRAQLQQPPVIVARDITTYETWPPRTSPTDTSPSAGGPRSGFSTDSTQIPPPDFTPPTPTPGRSPWADANDTDQAPELAGGAVSPDIWTEHRGPIVPSGSSAPLLVTPGGMAMAPGGVIGIGSYSQSTATSRSDGVPGRPGAARPATTSGLAEGATAHANSVGSGFVAPSGGLIGGRSSTATGSNGSPMARRRRNGLADAWTVGKGTPAVLEPTMTPDVHDPGPGVIGIDR